MIDEQVLQALGGFGPAAGDTFAPMSESDVAQVEAVLGHQLPSAYRHFLTNYGAVRFKKYVVVAPAAPLSKRASSPQKEYISVLYGKAINGVAIIDLVNQCRVYRGRMPENLLPIGNNGTGNQFCIGVAGGELGQVYYWDHNDEFDEEDYLEDLGVDLEDEDEERPPIPREAWFQNVYLVATSFEDLFRRLEVAPEE